jgi:putative toxin-antitoxin system antitoxin component (TIGR02293 family)
MTAAISSSALSAEAILGGHQALPEIPRSALDWISVIRKGIPSSAIDSIAKTIRVSNAELAATLGIPERTLARRKKQGLLNSEESAKLIRLARVIENAAEVFGSLATAIDWMKAENTALGGATPLSLLDTDIGAESVMDTLGRIAHGVFA